MLKDRLLLVEKEVTRLKNECGKLYLDLITNRSAPDDASAIGHKGERTAYYPRIKYEDLRSKLSDLMTEIEIIKQMISDGHE